MEFMTGETGKNLEYTIYKRFRDIDQLKVGQKDNDDQIEIIYDMVRLRSRRASLGVCGAWHSPWYHACLGACSYI